MSEQWSSGLNEAQRRAVEYDAGPVAVLAGPGTGKTRVLTHRVARLIERDGAAPESIGAFTFTVKAAEEMRTRLEELIGAGPASNVAASNFHSMGHRMLARFGDEIGLPAKLDLMDSVQRQRLLREAIGLALDANELPVQELAEGGRDGIALRAWMHITRFQQNAIFPDDAADLAEKWQHLIDRAGPEADPWDATRLDAEAHRLRTFSASTRIYAHFDRLRLDRGLLLYPDYILLPIRLLSESDRCRAIVHDEFRHVLVDEFQDVNLAQLQLLRKLAPPTPGRDICVVGDDDQAIYGFRGSDDLAFQHFDRIWTDATTIILDESYRSSPAIVETAQRVIAKAKNRFRPDKVLHARRPFPTPPPEHVDAVHVGHKSEIGPLVAAMILADRQQHPDRELSHLAVIARNRPTLAEVGRALQIEGIPVDDSILNPEMEDVAVLDVRDWIALLVSPSAAPMTRLLTRPPIAMDTARAIAFREALDRDHRIARAEGQEPVPIAEWIAEHADEHQGLARFASLYSELLDINLSVSASDMIRTIIERTGVAHRELPGAAAEADRIRALVRLVRYAEALQPRLDPPGDLAAFARYDAELDEDERIGALPGLDAPQDEHDRDTQPEGVRLLTAHGSKGLEFDTVFIPNIGATKGCFGNIATPEEPWLPPELSDPGTDTRDPKERLMDEERRLFYVACTRAERRLVVFSKRAKNRSTSMHLFQELTWPGEASPGLENQERPVCLQEGQNLLARCIELGVDLHGGHPNLTESSPVQARSAVLASARRSARLAAAEALDRAEEGLTDEPHAQRIEQTLREAARTLAIAHTLEAGTIDDLPDWLLDDGMDAAANRLSQALSRAREDRADEPGKSLALKPPLALSYSRISAYKNCPACFYLRHILKLSEGESGQQLLGIVAHEALQNYYGQWIQADAEGSPKPGLEELLRIGREVFIQHSRATGGADPNMLEQILAQLTTGFEALHNDADEVMMLEEKAPFGYVRTGSDLGPHHITAKIDRVDRLPDGGFRIIDYKTGQPWKKLLNPNKKDLQLGLYAMALADRLGLESVEELRGQAEYWIFATGERGVLRFEDIKFDKIRAQIDEAIDGMIAGRFEPKPGCHGPCRTFFGTTTPHT